MMTPFFDLSLSGLSIDAPSHASAASYKMKKFFVGRPMTESFDPAHLPGMHSRMKSISPKTTMMTCNSRRIRCHEFVATVMVVLMSFLPGVDASVTKDTGKDADCRQHSSQAVTPRQHGSIKQRMPRHQKTTKQKLVLYSGQIT